MVHQKAWRIIYKSVEGLVAGETARSYWFPAPKKEESCQTRDIELLEVRKYLEQSSILFVAIFSS